MPLFRHHTPKRREDPKTVSRYQDHRSDLEVDFSKRCGYCDDIDSWKVNSFEIDHFIPKKYLKTISETTYSNLVYSCRSCNNSKRSKWPSGREDLCVVNNEGFTDPCDASYKDQFERKGDGSIIPLTPHGLWMYDALKLFSNHHHVIWNIERVMPSLEEIEKLYSAGIDNVPVETLKKIIHIQSEFIKYVKELQL